MLTDVHGRPSGAAHPCLDRNTRSASSKPVQLYNQDETPAGEGSLGRALSVSELKGAGGGADFTLVWRCASLDGGSTQTYFMCNSSLAHRDRS